MADLLSVREVLERTRLSRPTFYRMRQRGEFPVPVRLANHARVVLWRDVDVERWCRANMPGLRTHRDP